MKSFVLLLLAVCLLGACANEDTFVTTSDVSPEIDERGPGCTVFPPGTIKAPGRDVDVEILESNSDFINHIWMVSPVEFYIGSDDDWGSVVVLPEVHPGDELIFEIRVHDPSDVPVGDVWQNGPGSRNADGAVHAIVERCPGKVFNVSFEDIPAGGWTGDEPNFVDAIFQVRRR